MTSAECQQGTHVTCMLVVLEKDQQSVNPGLNSYLLGFYHQTELLVTGTIFVLSTFQANEQFTTVGKH